MTRPGAPGQEQLKAQAILAELRAEREAVRAETRAMHEQVQEARDTLAALDKVMADAVTWLDVSKESLDAIVDAGIGARIDAHWELQQRLMNEVVQLYDDVTEKLAGTSEMVIAAQHEVLGLPDREKTMKVLEDRIGLITSMKLDDHEFRESVAARVSDELRELIGPTRALQAAARAQGRGGQVFVRKAEPGERLGMYIEGQYVEGSG